MPKQQIWGAAPDDWFHFSFVLGLTPDLLPVVSRPDAPISPTSKLKTIGKTPSHYNGQGMVAGLKDWTARTSTDDDVGRWAKQPDYGILLQTRTVRALDVDVSDPVVADAILSAVTTMIGPLPKRMRANSPKFLLAFQLEGQMSKRILRTEAGNIEFLATGQQFVALGTHPSGARYEWDGGLPDEIPVLGADDFEAVWCMLETVFGVGETVVEKEGRLRDRSARDAGATDETADYLDANDWTLDWAPAVSVISAAHSRTATAPRAPTTPQPLISRRGPAGLSRGISAACTPAARTATTATSSTRSASATTIST